jgi:hypothetical protein
MVSLLLLAFYCCAPIAAQAAFSCAEADGWSCFGVIEADSESMHCKYSTFRNGDRLLEARVDRGGKNVSFEKLTVAPSYCELYNDDDSLFLKAYGTIHVVTDAFKTAYPVGFGAVPEGHSVKISKIYNTRNAEFPLILTTDRSQHQIKYSIKFADNIEIAGVWNSEFPEPLPDTYDLQHWRHRLPIKIKILLDVRSLKPEMENPMKLNN